jgi:hypothetical protein
MIEEQYDWKAQNSITMFGVSIAIGTPKRLLTTKTPRYYADFISRCHWNAASAFNFSVMSQSF